MTTATEYRLEQCYKDMEHIDGTLQFWRDQKEQKHAEIMRLHAEASADLLCGLKIEAENIKEAR